MPGNFAKPHGVELTSLSSAWASGLVRYHGSECSRIDLNPEIGNVDIMPRMDVIEHIPSGVVRVLVDHEIIAAVPAPIGADRPVPGRNFKGIAPGKPEAPVVRVDAHNVVAIVGPEMFKTTVLKRVIEVKALVVRLVVSVPVIVVHVLRAVYFAVGAMLGFRLGVLLARRRRSGHASLICPRGIGTVGFGPVLPLFVLPLARMTLIGTLSECRECSNQPG